MTESLRPSTVLPSSRKPYKVHTIDGIELVVEVAEPLNPSRGALLMCHPNPTGGGMMDSHVYKKAANRLPALADLTIVRFNTRGTSSEQGTSTGEYGATKSEKFDVEAAIEFAFNECEPDNLWVMGWSFAWPAGRDSPPTGRPVGHPVSRPTGWLGHPVSRPAGWLAGWLVGWLVGWFGLHV